MRKEKTLIMANIKLTNRIKELEKEVEALKNDKSALEKEFKEKLIKSKSSSKKSKKSEE